MNTPLIRLVDNDAADCTREVMRATCSEAVRCGLPECPSCGGVNTTEYQSTLMEYELKGRQRGAAFALADAVDVLGKLRAQIARQMSDPWDGIPDAPPHGKNVNNPDGCGCDVCEAWRIANRAENLAAQTLVKYREAVVEAAQGREVHLWQRSIASRGAVSPADVEAMEAEAEEERATSEAAARADRIHDEARDREVLG